MNLSSGISSTWLYVCDIIVSYNELVTTWRLPGLCFDNSDIPASLLRALNWFWHDKNYLNCRILIWFLLIIFGISVIILFHFSPVNFFVSLPPVLLSWSWYSCRLHSWLLGGHFPLHIHFRKFLSGTFSLLIFKILKYFDNSMRGQLNNEQVIHAPRTGPLCTEWPGARLSSNQRSVRRRTVKGSHVPLSVPLQGFSPVDVDGMVNGLWKLPIREMVLCDCNSGVVAKAKCPGHKANSFSTVVSWSSCTYICLSQI